jgi:hypothetical protein
LLPEERTTLLALLEFADFDGRAALLEQAKGVRAVGYCPCGCATVGLVVDPACPSAGKTYRPIPNEAGVLDADGENIGGVIVFADDGYLSGLEIFSYADPINPFPPLDELRLSSRQLGPRPT